MKEIKCPNCGEIFQVDEAGYAKIAQQVRDKEFEKELERREQELDSKKKNEIELARMQQEKEFTEKLSERESDLKDKESLVEQLKLRIDAFKNEKDLAVADALKKAEEESNAKLALKNEELSGKTIEINNLKAELDNADTKLQLAVSQAVTEKDKELSGKENEITELKGKLESKENENQLALQNVKTHYEETLKLKDEQLAQYKDFKLSLSTKMVGESLEQYCQNQFNSIRMSSFPVAYFEKDNDARTGSKGDFIFRESADGTEFISIMFEMKNESDQTATKKKNEDFFKELDKDRREKGCEYAVLVSMLEADNDYYNNGIVDVSYRYEKMYVVRPQFFIPIISLLRNAALNSLKYRQELSIVRAQQLDICNFEKNVNDFKTSFGESFRKATDRYEDAIKGIDDTIAKLTKIRENLVKSEDHLNTANKKLDGVNIKKLTKNAPSVKAMFEDLAKEESNNN